MYVRQTNLFLKWMKKIKDIQGKVSILRRIDRIKNGNFGDCKYLGDRVYELRVKTGPGYRVYYTIKDEEIVVLLVGWRQIFTK